MDIARNDIPAALAYLTEKWDASQVVSSDAAEMLAMSQDDGGVMLWAEVSKLRDEREKKGLFTGFEVESFGMGPDLFWGG